LHIKFNFILSKSSIQFNYRNVAGISIRTNNFTGKVADDLGNLWKRLLNESITERIPNKLSDSTNYVSTQYSSDFTEDYTAFLGFEVNTIEVLPDDLQACPIPAGDFLKLYATFFPLVNAVVTIWQEIWNQDSGLNRAYKVDMEIYGPESQNETNPSVTI